MIRRPGGSSERSSSVGAEGGVDAPDERRERTRRPVLTLDSHRTMQTPYRMHDGRSVVTVTSGRRAREQRDLVHRELGFGSVAPSPQTSNREPVEGDIVERCHVRPGDCHVIRGGVEVDPRRGDEAYAVAGELAQHSARLFQGGARCEDDGSVLLEGVNSQFDVVRWRC